MGAKIFINILSTFHYFLNQNILKNWILNRVKYTNTIKEYHKLWKEQKRYVAPM